MKRMMVVMIVSCLRAPRPPTLALMLMEVPDQVQAQLHTAEWSNDDDDDDIYAGRGTYVFIHRMLILWL